MTTVTALHNPHAINLRTLSFHQREQAVALLGEINQSWMHVASTTRHTSTLIRDLSEIIGDHPLLTEMANDLNGMYRTVRNLQKDPFS